MVYKIVSKDMLGIEQKCPHTVNVYNVFFPVNELFLYNSIRIKFQKSFWGKIDHISFYK